ncbi:tRNA (adenine-N1)-methyltransferase [Spiroplasma platyhelix]|uniref:tRNA (adenine(58)-N(1))-methyltransferase TrmI n=1 Tax=Spiroplasma platyhelix PALS-1 TaxID=1276218 RepID=A0A846U161_9MOLU|nr:methyltransferase domain-containing protein [Spiroplasma platyhelix]MBE4704183.1 tRNA (adenine(58)-N(1))-methyltransferase TrmI [Spiroplasma platyhelix PALS-1]NKE38556.1 methyltransferase domain-containing protein [Spiroplasma platyhelix PALS-1]UJB29441.1 tRNA methyltransferase [Spiroplasma platyhelix PALS-1]
MKVKNNELIILFNPKMQFKIIFQSEMEFSTHKGIIKFPKLLKYGQIVTTNRDENFIILHANLADKMLKVTRSTTIVYPKDWGMIVTELGISSGKKIIEIGTGSGALTFTLANIVGAKGKIDSIDISKEKQDQGKNNFNLYSEFNNTTWHIIDLAKEKIKLSPADALFIDIPEPWTLLKEARILLKDGHTVGLLCPTFEQVKETANALNEFGFTRIRCKELIERTIYVRERSTRPADIFKGHTAFYLFAEKIADKELKKMSKLKIRQIIER